jgi:hypothetical protein
MTSITYPGIRGQLRVVASTDPDERGRIYIEGDPAGLKSLAALLIKLADVDQTELSSLQDHGASEHVHLQRSRWLTPQSDPELVVGRLDDKRGAFDETFTPRAVPPEGDLTHTWGGSGRPLR